MKKEEQIVLKSIWKLVSSLVVLLFIAIAWLNYSNKNPMAATNDTAINLTSSSIFDDQNPAFSPDGEKILFSSKRNSSGDNLNLWKMDVKGDNPVALTSEAEADNVNMPGSSWNGAINSITFSSDRSGNDEIWTMNPENSNLVQIINNPAQDWEPTFSADGKWIVFQSDRTGNWEIYKINLATGETIQLTNNLADDWQPNWSIIGDKIVFQSNRDGNWEIYTMTTEGADQRNLTADSAEDTDPSWSPDGARIVYSSKYGGLEEPEIFIINGDGAEKPTRVTSNPAYDGAPSFSPDGSKIAFESDRSGNLDLWIIDSSTLQPEEKASPISSLVSTGISIVAFIILLILSLVVFLFWQKKIKKGE